jgi:alpha(1,3/1,4) fucosyltransferase
MKPRIRLAFSDFYRGFDPRTHYLPRLLSQRYDIELSDDPDFVIYFSYSNNFLRYRCIRIFYTGENVWPDFTECDYAITFNFCNHPNHFRLPIYCRDDEHILGSKDNIDPRTVLAQKTGFCNFLYSNRYCVFRNRFFRKLSKYKRVDSGGKLLNNMGGGRVPDKMAFIKKFKFTIAFENESYPGYTTEKLIEPMVVNSLPIYWGNPRVHLDFNSHSFLNYYDYGSQDALVERIIEVDRDDELYCHYLRQPWFPQNSPERHVTRDDLLAHFDRIFFTPKVPIAQQHSVRRVLRIDRAWRGARSLRRKVQKKLRNARYHLDRLLS